MRLLFYLSKQHRTMISRRLCSSLGPSQRFFATGTSSSTTPTSTTECIEEKELAAPPLSSSSSLSSKGYVFIEGEGKGATPIRAWINGVSVEREAKSQLAKLSTLSDVIQHPIAAMPDLHYGQGATVGTVIPMTKAIIPAAVGVDIGCGMVAVRTSLKAEDLPANLAAVRLAIEVAVPHGRTHTGRKENDAGGWRGDIPREVADLWRKSQLDARFRVLCAKHPELERTNNINHLGTLGTGNHFIEICLDETQQVWVMLHSGSRGVGNRIGSLFIERAKDDMGQLLSKLPDADLAYLREGTQYFDDYVEALLWAQDFARFNREQMMRATIQALRAVPGIPSNFSVDNEAAINCHHNYVEKFYLSSSTADDIDGEKNSKAAIRSNNEHTTTTYTDHHCLPPYVWLTRKGATSAKKGELAVIPGSMGAASYIVRGKGNAESYCSCSHGAGRQFSRSESTRRFTLEDHERMTQGIECRKDKDVLDETPLAYKPIDDVMKAQADLVEIVHTLRQVVCVKG